ANERIAHLARALDAALPGGPRLGGVEVGPGDGVGELGTGAPIIDLRLGSFNLEFVENAGQFRHLLLVELQLVRQKAQRSAHAPSAAAFPLALGRIAVTAVATHESSSPLSGIAMPRLIVLREVVSSQVAPYAPGEMAHGWSPSRRGASLPAGITCVGP